MVTSAAAAHLGTDASLLPRTNKDGLVVILCINDLHVHHAGAQAQVLQVVPDDCRIAPGRAPQDRTGQPSKQDGGERAVERIADGLDGPSIAAYSPTHADAHCSNDHSQQACACMNCCRSCR